MFGFGKKKTSRNDTATTLANSYLVSAAPHNHARSPFAYSVILLLAHDEKGAMGVDLAKAHRATLCGEGSPISHLKQPWLRELPLFCGGPVQDAQMWLLTDQSHLIPAPTLQAGPYCFTTNMDFLDRFDTLREPARLKTGVGYCGWAPGQLESEIERGRWWLMPTEVADPFSTPWWSLYMECLNYEIQQRKHEGDPLPA
ncbi:YqgE/AlgH family protein [Hahella sp. SMD15-11]|uniref:YqgE/AlgH family protein n=1 Tax=Thermohahella caldifontis TaxID=3142973 RepID=A0AB39UTC7_9GAMM